MPTNLYKKQCLPVIKWNKSHLLKQVARIPYTLEKTLQLLLLKVWDSFLFRRAKQLVVYLVSNTILWMPREDKTKWILLMCSKLVFLCVDSWFDMPKFKYTGKNSSLKCWQSFRLFLWPTQKQFVVKIS